MSTQLSRSISTQGRVLRELAASSFPAQSETLAAAQRVVLVGTGSSFHAARLGAWNLRRRGLDAVAISSANQSRWEAPARPGDAVVVISHTGRTAHAMRARLDALAAHVPLVSVTGAQAGWPEAIVASPKETSDTYSVSYLAALGTLARLADGVDDARGISSPHDGARALVEAAERVESAVLAPDVAQINVPERAIVLVGTGPWAVTAAEGSLKLREASRVLAEGYDAETLLHGFAVPLTGADTLIALEPSVDPDGLIDGLAAAAHAEGVSVVTIEEPRPHPDPFYAQFSLTARLQLLAEHFAQRRGQNPDAAIVGCWNADSLWNAGRPVATTG